MLFCWFCVIGLFHVHLMVSECLCLLLIQNNLSYLKCHLFTVTEPDVGMPEKEAHRFFQQLIAGVVSGIFL